MKDLSSAHVVITAEGKIPNLKVSKLEADVAAKPASTSAVASSRSSKLSRPALEILPDTGCAGLKSATASSVTKPAKTETGLVVQVPPFINEGEKIRVDTSEGAYMSRA